MTREEFGRRFKAARLAAGLSQTAAAERLGISQPGLVEYEAGRKIPSVVRFVEIVERLGLDPKILFPEWFRASKTKTPRRDPRRNR